MQGEKPAGCEVEDFVSYSRLILITIRLVEYYFNFILLGYHTCNYTGFEIY